MPANVLMLHGINHNMFGKRDPRQSARPPWPTSTRPCRRWARNSVHT